MVELKGILNNLENVMSSGEGFTAKCPAHDDNKNSLSIKECDDGRILLHCFAGCSYADIVESLGYTQGGFKPSKKSSKEIVAIYDYFNEHHNLLYQVVRTDPKGFFQRRPDGHGGWSKGLGAVRRVPYHLPEVINSIKKNSMIFWTEGEKDAENLKDFGFTTTTTPMGAGNWKDEYADYFTNANIVMIPDADAPGEKYVQKVAKALKGKNARVRVLRLPNLKEKEDVSDWISRGGTKNELLNFVKDLPDYEIEIIEPYTGNSSDKNFETCRIYF